MWAQAVGKGPDYNTGSGSGNRTQERHAGMGLCNGTRLGDGNGTRGRAQSGHRNGTGIGARAPGPSRPHPVSWRSRGPGRAARRSPPSAAAGQPWRPRDTPGQLRSAHARRPRPEVTAGRARKWTRQRPEVGGWWRPEVAAGSARSVSPILTRSVPFRSGPAGPRRLQAASGGWRPEGRREPRPWNPGPGTPCVPPRPFLRPPPSCPAVPS